MRSKEEAHDYRYFPDPDLVPLVIDDTWMEEVKNSLPELPDDKKQRFVEQYAMPPEDARTLTSSRNLADYFETVGKGVKDKRLAVNWVTGAVLGLLRTEGLSIDAAPVSAEDLAELLTLLENGAISAKAAKTVFDDMVSSKKAPGTIVREKGLEQVSDQSELAAMVAEVIAANPDEHQSYKEGKTKLFSFFMGQIMKKSRGKADPKMVTELLKQKL